METLNWSHSLLEDPHAAPDKAQRVEAMFARIARRYDLANRLHTFGLDQLWRTAAAKAAKPGPGRDLLDVACGTGDLTGMLYRRSVRATFPAPRVIGLDASEAMLAVARRKFARLPVRWLVGDALALPFAEASFDAVTIAFGLRNVQDTPAALAEMTRVLRPGGRLVVLEFAPPTNPLRRRFIEWFSGTVMPITGALITGDRGGAYRYLNASIRTYLEFDQLAEAIRSAGVVDVRSRSLPVGPVGLHVGVRP